MNNNRIATNDNQRQPKSRENKKSSKVARDNAASSGKPRNGTVAPNEERKGQSTVLIELASDAELWHTVGHGDAYATFTISGHAEHWPIRSRAFKRLLCHRFFSLYQKALGAQAVQDALNVLEGNAIFEGPKFPVHIRVAGVGDTVYVDLANDSWQVVEIDAAGWRVREAIDVPVRFRRAKAMLPLPNPIHGGDISELRGFVNVTDEDWPLLLGWLVGSLRPIGPYPALNLNGEQGSAKSTTARTLRMLIDPNTAPLRSEPRDARDLMIAANNGWLVCLDNLSNLQVWFSDALCRLATGGGFATRTLYENDEETIFDSMRPSILTGIEELASRSDLLDRSLVLSLPRITLTGRRTESAHWRDFGFAHARILGALLDAVSAAICNLPTTHIAELPRMADFALWATAAEQALGLQPDEFMCAYRGNKELANDTVLESVPVSKYIFDIADSGDWDGTPTELFKLVESIASETDKRLRAWPRSARVLSGSIKRVAPNLRLAGLDVEFGFAGRGRQKQRNISIRRMEDSCAPSDPSSHNPKNETSSGNEGDAFAANGDDSGTQLVQDFGTEVTELGTHVDGGDDAWQAQSERVQVTL